MNISIKRFFTISMAVGMMHSAHVFSQSFDETEVTAVARALAAPDDKAAALQHLLDRQAIYDVLIRYTRGLDRHDKLLIASAFWPDAQVNYGDTFTGLRDEFVHWSVMDDKKRFVSHTHNITNQTIDIDGDDAHTEFYIVGVEHKIDGRVQVVGGRYIDRLQKRNGEWRIVLREFLVDTKGTTPKDDFIPGESCGSACGRLDKLDLSYKRPLEPRPMPSK